MRKLTVVLVAAMLLLAGCSGGGGGAASPSENATGTPANESGADIDMSQPSSPDGLLNQSSGSGFDNATDIDLVLYNGTEQISLVSKNDTESGTKLLELTTPDSGTRTVYTTSEYVAFRNSSNGEEEYGGPDSRVGSGVSFGSALLIFGATAYTDAVQWDAAGTTTVDGEGAFVYEADSLNQTSEGQQGLNPAYEQDEVESVDGRLVIGPEGRIYDIRVEIEAPDGTYGTDMSVRYGDISITKPSWVDESQAP